MRRSQGVRCGESVTSCMRRVYPAVTPRPESSRGALVRSSAPLEDSGRGVTAGYTLLMHDVTDSPQRTPWLRLILTWAVTVAILPYLWGRTLVWTLLLGRTDPRFAALTAIAIL